MKDITFKAIKNPENLIEVGKIIRTEEGYFYIIHDRCIESYALINLTNGLVGCWSISLERLMVGKNILEVGCIKEITHQVEWTKEVT